MTYYYDLKRHLVCVPFSVENLHAMAIDLGIPRHFYHKGRHPHYDVPKTRMADIGSRATLVDSRIILGITKGQVLT